jgi:hypothetical protein
MKKLLAVALLFSACDLGRSAPAADTFATKLQLRIYEVPGGAAPQIRSVLKDVFWFGNDNKDSNKYIGRADVTPDGRLAVLASDGVQEGVKALIDSLATHPPAPNPTVRLTFWVVTGTPVKSHVEPPATPDISEALAEIEKNDGPQQFVVAEKMSATALSGEKSIVTGRETKIYSTATATAAPQSINADLSFERAGNRMETRMRLQPAQTIVLSSAGAAPKEKDDVNRSIYYLVRATAQ